MYSPYQSGMFGPQASQSGPMPMGNPFMRQGAPQMPSGGFGGMGRFGQGGMGGMGGQGGLMALLQQLQSQRGDMGGGNPGWGGRGGMTPNLQRALDAHIASVSSIPGANGFNRYGPIPPPSTTQGGTGGTQMQPWMQQGGMQTGGEIPQAPTNMQAPMAQSGAGQHAALLAANPGGFVDANGIPRRAPETPMNPGAGQWGQYQTPTGDGFTGTRNGQNFVNGHLFAAEGLNQSGGTGFGTGFGNWLEKYAPMMQQQGIIR
jgi:hypothetical protein